ncbi:M14 family metallopeptidase [Planctomycetes bacterium K23_9]
MFSSRKKTPIDNWQGQAVPAGETSNVRLAVSESYSGISLRIPIQIQRAKEDGPVVFITAALHGDELNGTGAIRQLICDSEFELQKGSLILVPILNLLAFDRHSRYLPDRRDLNRCFPGSKTGSLAGRMANQIFEEIVTRSDFGIDLHTASVRRTNYPNVRADCSNPLARDLAFAFGSEFILNSPGPEGAFRREACKAGCSTIVMEGGEVWKVEPAIVHTAVRGIKNILVSLNMIDGDIETPETQFVVEQTKWIRADRGGFLQFHVQPGQIVQKDQPLASNTDLLGTEQSVLVAPFNGVILGMTTLPAISPGEPLCMVGRLPKGTGSDIKEARIETGGPEEQSLEERTLDDLSSNVMVVEKEADDLD